ncbi:alpha/beta hydrolase [Lacticaseibacillus yichunensis]|uniref:Alpha/beta hydrolase n=2 Tax=Bacilli TaxID=91061 RepID=A0ABW4CTH7_9LACO|nr:alpha/beta hydrolase [Lacticaseibacillus yichunensis]
MTSRILINAVYEPIHELKVDVYLPTTPVKAGIIDIHGGGWFRGDKQKDADWATRLNDLGYLVFVPNYRYAPAVHYSTPLTDVETLVEWIGDQYALPTTQLAAVGGSAGGNMAVELALKYGMPAVSLSGILDIEQWLATHKDVVAKQGDTSLFNVTASASINQSGSDDQFYKWFVTNYFAEQSVANYHAATPSTRVTAETGPLYLANSLAEFVPSSGVLQMAAALTANQVPFTMRLLAGRRHAKGYLADVDADVVAFLQRNLPPA